MCTTIVMISLLYIFSNFQINSNFSNSNRWRNTLIISILLDVLKGDQFILIHNYFICILVLLYIYIILGKDNDNINDISNSMTSKQVEWSGEGKGRNLRLIIRNKGINNNHNTI